MPKYSSILTRQPAIVIMGVCGTGKSLIGRSLAERIDNSVFIEGDEFHPIDNIESMKAGIPLTDQQRAGWLYSVGSAIEASRLSLLTICSCSALKKKYRDQLRALSPSLVFIHLTGNKALIEQRMNARDHFMPPQLLDSQLDILEPPQSNEGNIIEYDIQQTPQQIIDMLITNHLSTWTSSTQKHEAGYD